MGIWKQRSECGVYFFTELEGGEAYLYVTHSNVISSQTWLDLIETFLYSLQLYSYTATLVGKRFTSDQPAKTPNQARAHDCHGDCRFRFELVPVLHREYHRHHPGY